MRLHTGIAKYFGFEFKDSMPMGGMGSYDFIDHGGGKIMNGPHQVSGGNWVVTAAEPQGAAFGVVGPQGA